MAPCCCIVKSTFALLINSFDTSENANVLSAVNCIERATPRTQSSVATIGNGVEFVRKQQAAISKSWQA
jgi:hypothetical protein